MLENDTRNQHFLSKVEQKLNACNPNADHRNLRIYSFRLLDRENYKVELENPKGHAIDGNLFLYDLFSFDLLENNNLRLNFESLFHKYEAKLEAHTHSLLDKVKTAGSDIKTEIIEIFTAKMLNFVRNPYSVVKVLNTFPGLANYYPTDPILLQNYYRIINGKKPQQQYLCKKLGISEQQYQEWLRILFMLLAPMQDGAPNFFEEMIKGLLLNKKMFITAFLCRYDHPACLLSDRGYSIPIPENNHMAFSFNLCSTAFITYLFADPRKLAQDQASPEFINETIASWEKRSQIDIDVRVLQNDVTLLKNYNSHVIYQCFERVYCAVKDFIN